MERSDDSTEVELGPHKIKVIKGGFYDLFRSSPDLA